MPGAPISRIDTFRVVSTRFVPPDARQMTRAFSLRDLILKICKQLNQFSLSTTLTLKC